MPNPYHDSQGRFASHDELKQLVQSAYDDGRLDDYIRERENLEAIEREVARSKDSNGSGFWDTPEEDRVEPVARSVRDFENANKISASILDGTYMNRGALSSWDMEDADPYDFSLGSNPDNPYLFSDDVLDVYVANSSHSGLSGSDKSIELHSVMSDYQGYWPSNQPAVLDPYNNEQLKFDVSEAHLELARKQAAEEYSDRMNRIRAEFITAPDLHKAAEDTHLEMMSARATYLEDLKRAKFELAYIGSQYDRADDWSTTENKIDAQMMKIQESHDAIVYTHATDRAVERFVESAE